MGTRGPVGKRSDARIRRNKPVVPVEKIEDDGAPIKAPYDPPRDAQGEYTWHPIALETYFSFESSGQSRLFEDSDWMQLYFLCEAMDRDLKPQFVGMRQVDANETRPVKMTVPIKGASLNAYRAGLAALMATEADRRRLQVEIVKASTEAAKAGADVPTTAGGAAVLDIRSRLAGGAPS